MDISITYPSFLKSKSRKIYILIIGIAIILLLLFSLSFWMRRNPVPSLSRSIPDAGDFLYAPDTGPDPDPGPGPGPDPVSGPDPELNTSHERDSRTTNAGLSDAGGGGWEENPPQKVTIQATFHIWLQRKSLRLRISGYASPVTGNLLSYTQAKSLLLEAARGSSSLAHTKEKLNNLLAGYSCQLLALDGE